MKRVEGVEGSPIISVTRARTPYIGQPSTSSTASPSEGLNYRELLPHCQRCALETPAPVSCECGGNYCIDCLAKHQKQACPLRRRREDLGFRSQRYCCPEHQRPFVLRQLDGPRGVIHFWACDAAVNCSEALQIPG